MLFTRKIATFGFLLSLMLVSVSVQAQDMPSAAATNYEMRLSAVEDQMRALTGKVEQLDYAIRRMDQAAQRMQSDYDMRLNKLESATVISPPQPSQPIAPIAVAPQPTLPVASASRPPVSAPPAADGDVVANPNTSVKGTLGAIKFQDGHITGGAVSPQAPALPAKPDDYGLTAQEQYDRAFGLLREANYDEAEKAFKGFIDKNPQDKLIDNAKYWYAETFYVRAKFQDSAVAFADAYQQNPKGTKAPDSLLKLAMALASLDKKSDACSTLDSLKSNYPNAPSTIRSRADQERATLKCGKAG